MMLMMKKNLGAYLHYYLTDLGTDTTFIKDLLRASIDPSLLHNIQHCTWDKKSRLLITPDCEEEEQKKAMETAAWYKNSFESLTNGKGETHTHYTTLHITLTPRAVIRVHMCVCSSALAHQV